MNPDDFGKSFKGFMDQMNSAVAQESPLGDAIKQHFVDDCSQFPTMVEKFEAYDQPNIQMAMNSYLEDPGRSHEIKGVTAESEYVRCSLANLICASDTRTLGGHSASEGPVQYLNVTLEDENTYTCVTNGLYLIRDGGDRLAVLLQGDSTIPHNNQISLEVMASSKVGAERFFSTLRTLLKQRNVYRGHVISVTHDYLSGLKVTFHKLPAVSRDSIVLPDGLLGKIERQTIGFGKKAQMLLAAGRHLKTGLLLHGPPGTGKTLTAMYISSEISERTVILMTGRGLGLVGQSCRMARSLQPSIVIMEDVDLIAEERGAGSERACSNVLLFELLNEMDGLADDCDVMFLLTTNRPELLEPALASRPGRVDQVFEIPLPDESCRKKLFELYMQGMENEIDDLDSFVDRTTGSSAAFIRELLRKAALFATEDGDDIVVRDKHLDEAMHEMIVAGGELSHSILGFKSS